MISIELLPAAHGDAIWIEYGSPSQPHCILIDGGPAPTYESGLRRRIAMLPEQKRRLELMVVTHIDADHIDGALILLRERAALKIRMNDLWFNGWAQISREDEASICYAPLQGEFLGGLIEVDPELKDVWNMHFDHGAVVVRDDGPLPIVELHGGARLTLLGPLEEDLRRLRASWASAIRDFSPGDVDEALRRLRERREYRPPSGPVTFAVPQSGDDKSVTNGSSISFVFEYSDISILLTGDAHAPSLEASLKRLADQRSLSKLHFDAVKLPHHGSMSNVSDAWLQWVDCECWLISTNGAVFNHPDIETAELIANHYPRPMLCCNYPHIAERLDQEAHGRWSTSFLQGETASVAGGLHLSWPASSRRQRGIKLSWMPGETGRKMDGT
jgi:beta-lactamase superfamily II metal-dependent hydrolase